MIYVCSDLHGYPLERIQRKLKELEFGDNDHLYVLGDCIDRGSDGLKILRWLMPLPNATLLMGNHEWMLLKNRDLFDGDTVPAVLDLVGERRESYSVWVSNGGYSTIDAMKQFTDAQIKHLFRFLEKAPLYKEIEVNGKKYILTHSGLGNFEKDKPLSEYTEEDLLWNRPALDAEYYDDGRVVVFGHTPTVRYGQEYSGKPIIKDTWINIDVGAGLGLQPLILRLDDLRKIFI